MDKKNFDEITSQYEMGGDGEFFKYECLSNVASESPDGIFLEIGFRNGTGILSMIMGRKFSEKDLYVGVDPYGNIPFKIGNVTRKYDYTNEKRKTILYNFYRYLNDLEHTRNFIFFNLESIEFFNRYEDGIPDYYSGNKIIRSDYSVVHIDGQHDTGTVLTEVRFFADRILPGGFLVLDNTESNWMDMSVIEKEIFEKNYNKDSLSVKDKWVYRKDS